MVLFLLMSQNKSKSRGQIELEFLSLVSLVLILFVMVYLLSFQKQVDMQHERNSIFAKQLCSFLASEVDFATAIGAGYEKNITLPELLGDKVDYGVVIDNAEQSVVLTWDDGSCRSYIKSNSVSGNFAPGFNSITNNGSGVVISQ